MQFLLQQWEIPEVQGLHPSPQWVMSVLMTLMWGTQQTARPSHPRLGWASAPLPQWHLEGLLTDGSQPRSRALPHSCCVTIARLRAHQTATFVKPDSKGARKGPHRFRSWRMAKGWTAKRTHLRGLSKLLWEKKQVSKNLHSAWGIRAEELTARTSFQAEPV